MKRREIEQASHQFKDPADAIGEADYRPRICGIPEQSLVAAGFIKMKRDYGGPLPAVLQSVGAERMTSTKAKRLPIASAPEVLVQHRSNGRG